MFIVIAVYVGAIVTVQHLRHDRRRPRAHDRAAAPASARARRAQRRAVAREGLLVGVIGAAGRRGRRHRASRSALDASRSRPDWSCPTLALRLPRPGADPAADRRRRAHHLARVVDRVAPGAHVTPLQAIGGSAEPSREESCGPPRPQRASPSCSSSLGGRSCSCSASLVGLVSPARRAHRRRRRRAVVHRPRARRAPRSCRRRCAWSGGCSAARRRRDSPPRTRCGTRSAARAPRSASSSASPSSRCSGSRSRASSVLILAAQAAQPEVYAGHRSRCSTSSRPCFSVLIGFSALIAAVGLVNNLSLSVLQRTRELGLLRALGFSARQLRRMILSESAQLTVDRRGRRARARHLLRLGGRAVAARLDERVARHRGARRCRGRCSARWCVGAAALTVVASIAPTRRATRVSPVTALAVE